MLVAVGLATLTASWTPETSTVPPPEVIVDDLDAAFLDQRPTDSELLDHLRSRRLLPEQADFRTWKAQTLAAYKAMDPVETVWHLPDGRALRVVASPNPQVGVTYLFDDATQSFALASQLNALTRVQGETLDALKEGVAVFGADGRMKLINPAFAALWRFDPARAAARPHIDEVARDFLPLLTNPALWDGLRATIVGLPEARRAFEARIERISREFAAPRAINFVLRRDRQFFEGRHARRPVGRPLRLRGNEDFRRRWFGRRLHRFPLDRLGEKARLRRDRPDGDLFAAGRERCCDGG